MSATQINKTSGTLMHLSVPLLADEVVSAMIKNGLRPNPPKGYYPLGIPKYKHKKKIKGTRESTDAFCNTEIRISAWRTAVHGEQP